MKAVELFAVIDCLFHCSGALSNGKEQRDRGTEEQ